MHPPPAPLEPKYVCRIDVGVSQRNTYPCYILIVVYYCGGTAKERR